MKKKYSNILVGISLLIITFLICMLSPLDIFTFNGGTWTDSSVFKYIGWQMAEGQVPYLDMFDHKGLVIYFINYFGYLISPHRGVWFIELAFMFVTVLFTYKIAHKFVSKPLSLLITLITLAPLYNYFGVGGGNYTEEYALPMQLIALYIFFDFFLTPKKYMSSGKDYKTKLNFKFFNFSVFFCGCCFAGVLFLRPNMVSVWAVFGIMVLIYSIVNKKYLELFKFILSFILGILVISIPMLMYLILNGAFQSFIDDYILFNMSYTSSESNLGSIAQLWNTFLNNPLIVFAFVIVISKIYLQVKNKEKWYFNAGYLIYMLLTFAFVCMSGRAYGHYAITIVSILIYPFCILYDYLKHIEIKNNGITFIITIVLIVIFVASNWLNILTQTLVDISGEENIPFTSSIVDYIKDNTKSDDLISVFGNNDIIYNFSGRSSASKYSYQVPLIFIDKKIEEEYFDDLKKNSPKIIVSCQNLSEYPEFSKKWASFLDNNDYKLKITDGCDVYMKQE